MRATLLWSLVTTMVVGGPALAQAENWPQFRGPGGAGTSEATNLPTTWSATTNIAWKVEIPGVAWSSPIVWGDRLFLTTAIGAGKPELPRKGLYLWGERPKPKNTVFRWEVLCFDKNSGKLLWRQQAHQGEPATAIHLKNSYASETPATDGQRLFAFFGAAGLYAYDLDGQLLWKKDLGAYSMRMGWGTASSPVVAEGRVFIQRDNQDDSFVVALDAKSGQELWRAKRAEKSSWSTPFYWKNNERAELVTNATQRVRSYDPATGKLLWELGGNSSIPVPTPIAGPDFVYVSSGYIMDRQRPLDAVRPGASGDITPKGEQTTSSGVAWSQPRGGPYMPTPIYCHDRIYVLYDGGFIACFDAKTGAAVYSKQRIAPAAGAFTASPWAYGGKIFCLSEDGDTFVVEAGTSFKLAGKNALGEMCMATPALADGSLYIRGINHLFCVRATRQPSTAAN